ncbi:MAG: alpha/beta hydrolase [Beijerinckiaceae bacterium]
MVPVTFDDCLGWLHPAAGGRGVVLCSAFGYEELCSRRTMRELADAIAAAGLPTLRFDYHGTADSAGSSTDPARIPTWIANIDAAIDVLRRETGVREVALVGLRLGALLVAHVAARRGDICALALLAAPNSGRAYRRELTALSRLLVPPVEPKQTFDGLDVAGFRLAGETLDALSGLDWPSAPIVGGPRILSMSADETHAKGLASRIRPLATSIVEAPFDSYAKMMCDPTASMVPSAAIARLTEWIAADAPPAGARPVAARMAALIGDTFVETPAQIGEGGRLIGILCRAISGEQQRKAILFLNAGAIYHIGWARMHVDMARELAHSGVSSLRLDLAGIGDSDEPKDGAAQLYDSALSADVQAALDWLEARGIGDLTVFGSCSGAYQAFHAAISDRRIKRLALVNQLCFVWGPAYAVQLQAWRRTKSTEVAARQDLSDATVRMLTMRGLAARAMPFAKSLAKFALRHATNLAVRATMLWNGKNLVERWFGELSKRGTRVLLVYSDNDAGLIELERYMGPQGCSATALPGVTKRLIANADHTFTPVDARRHLREALKAFVTDNALPATMPG